MNDVERETLAVKWVFYFPKEVAAIKHRELEKIAAKVDLKFQVFKPEPTFDHNRVAICCYLQGEERRLKSFRHLAGRLE